MGVDESKEESSSHCSGCGWPDHRKTTCKKFHIQRQSDMKGLQRQLQLNVEGVKGLQRDHDSAKESNRRLSGQVEELQRQLIREKNSHLGSMDWDLQREVTSLKEENRELRQKSENDRQSLLAAQNHIIHLQAR